MVNALQCVPRGHSHICLLWLSRQCDVMLLIKASATVTVIEDTVKPSYLPGINSLFIMCMGIIRNNYLVGGRTWAEA